MHLLFFLLFLGREHAQLGGGGGGGGISLLPPPPPPPISLIFTYDHLATTIVLILFT